MHTLKLIEYVEIYSKFNRKCRFVFSQGRRRPSGSALAFTLLVAVVLFILGCGYLGLIERDNRFAGYQERSEKAWNLAQSGWEYYALYGCGATLSSASSKAISPPKSLLKVYVPSDSRNQYFELLDMGQARLLCRGVVCGTLNTYGTGGNVITRDLVVPVNALERAYDASLSVE